ncbi:hypothetical protein [Aporhodopirellula aestuarii]|uniref:Uncharacterized protein n=1 Tax=Aporhodopirellula aestuarii TaxID=2950107 RepID=A0ABT0U8T9_9BACT|nr:hypothetical protein [Aporhodopirellula aestuarii]MCM2373308.1 hypothetical protein [Aporhodopirellula aestuarii]
MQEDLLGYLLGALEPDEMRRVEQWLREDAEARRELAELERLLERLEEADDADETPPIDLVSRTLANLPPLPPSSGPSGETEYVDHLFEEVDGTTTERERIFGELSLSSTSEGGGETTWSLRDWGASLTAAAILVAISIPPLLEGRFAARKAACQDRLRELGVAMTQFASRNAQSRLPSVAPDGYQAFAGVYAPRLQEAGLLSSPEQTFCPSIDRDELWETTWASQSTLTPAMAETKTPMLVSLRMLDEVGRELSLASDEALRDDNATDRMMRAIERLRWIQMTAGGHFAYTLGVREGEHFSSPRFQGRSQFAVMSDAAITRVNVRSNSLDDPAYRMTLLSHGGRGINVLYEDGHVGFLPSESLDRIPDNPLVNHDGLIEAGVTIDDATLAPSWQPPFIRANQR